MKITLKEEDDDMIPVRTNRCEWVSGIHIEILDDTKLKYLEFIALENGKQLDKHYDCYETGEMYVWCYKNDIEELYKPL